MKLVTKANYSPNSRECCARAMEEALSAKLEVLFLNLFIILEVSIVYCMSLIL